jgi:hypothetical protein
MASIRRLIFLALILCATTAWGQSVTRKPNIGYLYPSGAQQGSVVQITAGGQFLNGATKVYVSGQGVQAKVIKYIRPLRNINREQRQLLQSRLREVRQTRLEEITGKVRRRPGPPKKIRPPKTTDKSKTNTKDSADKKAEVKMPEHPILLDLDNKSLRELAHITNIIFFPRWKQQINRQLAEMVLIEITVDPDTQPGNRELRILTSLGLTNPMIFQVGLFPEIRELEPNNDQAYPDLRRQTALMKNVNLQKAPNLLKPKPLELPVLLNGQIYPGDVDRFRFRARQGQQLVIEAQARSLIPYLADAVPGWFQATLALYNAAGNEIAFADDYRFNPDPVLFYKIPKTGEYELEIHDSIYRGREDFVYRIAVGEQPFVTEMYPLGGKAGIQTVASIDGWNLNQTKLTLDTQPGDSNIRHTTYQDGKRCSNSIPYAVDTLPERYEAESNNSIDTAQPITLPILLNGRISKSGDKDVFKLQGRAGDKIVAEIFARRLNSPLDSLLRLTDASGKVIAWNDDYVEKDSHLHKDRLGLMTHHADSYLLTELPQDGTYYVHLADSQHHGGKAYGYRLRVVQPQGDFALRVTPSSLYVTVGGNIVPISVHALRNDGFDGEIQVEVKNAPAGFKLNGGRIPAGTDHIRMTLTTPGKAPAKPVSLQLQGYAKIAGKTITRPVVPADDMMQAFLYRHLVPSQNLMVAVKKTKWSTPPVALIGKSPVRIPAGGTTQVRFKTRKRTVLKEMKLVLKDPPEGLTLQNVTVIPEGLAFRLKAEKDSLPDGFTDNLIIEAFREYRPKQKNGKLAAKKRRYSMGVLPAIPIEIVPQ